MDSSDYVRLAAFLVVIVLSILLVPEGRNEP
jgi:hypothetical protein